MEYLTPEYWNLFRDSEGKFIGKEFEELIHDILKLGFGGSWQQTPLSWDGGKDFINLSFDGKSKGWAECKMYKKNLTTHNFAKTLVMAINNSIDSIIIFSYSPLVKNAKIHLGDFSNITGKDIQAFDDVKFEKLIFKFFREKEFAKYFPDFQFKQQANFIFDPYSYYNFISEDITIEWSQVDEQETQERNITTKRNTPCLYELCFISNLLIEEDLEINFSPFFNGLGQLNYGFNFVNLPTILIENQEEKKSNLSTRIIQNTFYKQTVFPGQILSLKLYFIPIDVGELIIPPINFQFGKIQSQFDSKKIIVSSIASPVLTGSLIHETIHNTEQVISSNNRVIFQIVNGKSGIGKTRYAKEIIDKLLKYNFQVIMLDGETSNCKSYSKFIVELLTQLYKLPNPYKFENKDIAFNIYEKEGAYTKEDENVYTIIRQCIQNQDIKKSELKKTLLPLLYKLILSRRSALIIDNVQSLDNRTIKLIYKLLELNNTVGQNFLMYIFNTETLDFNSKSGSLYNQLQSNSSYKENFITIESFKDSEVRLFIDSTIKLRNNKLFSIEHKTLFEKIKNNVPARPFYLSQFIDLLLQENVIAIEQGNFYVNNIPKLNNSLSSFSDKETYILEARVSKLTKAQTDALDIISYFGEIDLKLLQIILKEDIKHIDNLIQLNFLIKEYGKVKIIHSLMETYLINKILIQGNYFNPIIRERLFEIEFITRQFPHVLFSIAENKTLFDASLLKTYKLSENSPRSNFYAKKILDYIYLSKDKIDPDRYLYAIIKIISYASHNDKKLFLIKLFEMWEYLTNYIPTNNKQAIYYTEIVRECGSFFAVQGKYSRSINVLDDGIKKVFDFSCDSKTKDKLVARLNNRKGVSYKKALNFDKSKESLLLALDLSIKSNNIIEKYLTYIDLGYIDYGRDNKNTKKYWKEIYNMPSKDEEEILAKDPETGLACILIKSLYNGINGNFDKAITLSNKLIDIAQSLCSIYYELQGYRSKVFFEFKRNFPKEILEEQLIKIISISSKAKIYKYHIFAYHLLAIMYEKNDQQENAKRHYQYILERIKKGKISNPSIEICLFISDSINYYKRHNHKYPLNNYEILQMCQSTNPLNALGINSPFTEERHCLTLA